MLKTDKNSFHFWLQYRTNIILWKVKISSHLVRSLGAFVYFSSPISQLLYSGRLYISVPIQSVLWSSVYFSSHSASTLVVCVFQFIFTQYSGPCLYISVPIQSVLWSPVYLSFNSLSTLVVCLFQFQFVQYSVRFFIYSSHSVSTLVACLFEFQFT